MSKRRIRLHLQAWQGRRIRQTVGPHAIGLVYETPLGTFAIHPEDDKVGRELREDGVYAPDEVERLLEHVQPTSNVLVVGAHVGTLVVPLSKHAASVVAIEANPVTEKLLRLNVAMNRCDNVTVHGVAASNEPGAIEFLLSTANSGGSKRAPKTEHYMYTYDNPERVQVPGVRLDDLLTEHHAGTTFDVIVMDIEGSEFFALQGMPKTLSASRVLQIEYIPHHLSNVAGVGVSEFIAPLREQFDQMT